ncbi:MAG: elongation factor P [Candidatus Latescibacteria bacterium]|nr:elongation factor P [Candidatus Latescibacterota bacterium]NIM20964.1 elongation factor P [Candidatus Latescibacterota bacterium]NIM65099.1 elongation factor P [Candidatus Latescibacterota bacterium]NIO01614.1 elongation factor P [Candidatus Latescibacterota bacterium]NIO28131.1 elongation factor P [Candidatus Latescibacterota bacterium]
MADTSDFRNGMILNIGGEYWIIMEFLHVKPGKGGAFVRTRIKNLITGQVKDQTFRGGEKVNEVRVERRAFQYLYASGGLYYMMDKGTYEQIPLPEPMVEDVKGFLKESLDVTLYMEGDKPLLVELPNFVDLVVKETEPGLRGDTAQGGSKPATLETGVVVNLPLFIEIGDTVRIDTRTGKYVTRV